jgi:hypothetical protein
MPGWERFSRRRWQLGDAAGLLFVGVSLNLENENPGE